MSDSELNTHRDRVVSTVGAGAVARTPRRSEGVVGKMWIRVLGPVRAGSGDAEAELGSPQQRIVFAVLALAAGGRVSSSMLTDVLWDGAPPAAATATIQQYASRLRRALRQQHPGPEPDTIIRRASGGYQLTTAGVDVDVLNWRALVAQARAAAVAGDNPSAVGAYARALELWSGPVAADLPDEARKHPVFAGLDREHAVVLCEAAEAGLQATLIGDLATVVRRGAAWHRFDEGVQACLIRVLAAEDNLAEATRHYRQVQQDLAQERGIEPGPLLQEAYGLVLARVSAPAAAEPAEDAGSGPEPVRPRLLPAAPGAFSGRETELSWLDEFTGGAPPLVLVTGLGGAGKTSLVLHWAHRQAAAYPDGQLYVDLRGFAPQNAPMKPADALHSFLEALGVPRKNQPSALAGLAGLYRRKLEKRKVLVVLDNARDEEQLRPLLPTGNRCTVMVTSRSHLGALVVENGARSLGLGVFSDEDAHRFLRSRLGDERVNAELPAAAEMIEVCRGLPLALAICAAWAQRSPAFTLSAVAAELRRRDGLDAFTGVTNSRDVRAVFSWSYQRLTTEAARLFRRLGATPGPDVATATAASIGGRARPNTLELLTELVDAQLLTEVAPGRYGMHDLIRAYAAELVTTRENEATVRRSIDHYMHSAMAASALIDPERKAVAVEPPVAGVTPWSPADRGQAMTWFGDELTNLRAAFDAAETHGLDEYLWRLAFALNATKEQLGLFDEMLMISRRALVAAERRDATWWRSFLHIVQGSCYHQYGVREKAHWHTEMATKFAREANDPLRTALCLLGVSVTLTDGDAWPADDQIEHAAELAHEARTMCERVIETVGNDPQRTADARMARLLISDTYHFSAYRAFHHTGDAAAARAEIDKGIEICGAESFHAPWLLETLGRIYSHAGDDVTAIKAYEQAAAVLPDGTWVIVTLLVPLAGCHARLGNQQAVDEIRTRARRYLEGIYHTAADRLRARLDELEPAR